MTAGAVLREGDIVAASAGNQAPPNGAVARPLAFTISPRGGATGVCDSETIAAPWNPAFLAQWDAMLAALSAHLKSAGTYGDITLLRLTGINRTTDEFRLPAETPRSTGIACVSDAVSIWQQAGYRPSLLQRAWDQVTDSFQKSFPTSRSAWRSFRRMRFRRSMKAGPSFAERRRTRISLSSPCPSSMVCWR